MKLVFGPVLKLRRFLECPLSFADYVQLLQERGVLD